MAKARARLPASGMVAVALGAAAAQAQELPATGAEPRIADVVVTATRVPQRALEIPAAIDSVDAWAIREGRAQVNLSEVLGPVPGVVVRNRQNYAQDLQVSVRGFGGRASFGVRGVRLLADGIPATMPDGQGQTGSFDLATADRIEVLRGPFASLYGNSSGGVVQVFTAGGPPQPEADVSFVAGSDGLRKAGVRAGGRQGDLDYVAGASRFRTDGYREHSAATRDLFNAKVSSPLASGRLTLVAGGLDQPDSQDPLGLTRSQFEADPRQADPAALLFNTRKSVRQGQLGAVQEVALGQDDALQARLYGGTRDVVQFLAQSGDTPLGSGGVVDLDRRYGGAGVRWTSNFRGERPVVLSVGAERDALDERRRGYVNDRGVQGALRRDEDDRVASTGAYALGEWRFAPGWSASAGVRASRVAFESRDHYVTAANPDDSGDVTYSRTLPVAGIVFEPAPHWRLYANAGEGFETPTFAELAYRPGGQTGLNFELRPARSRHAEVGAKARLGEAGRLAAALFRIDTEDEIVVDTSAGGRTTFKNASRTRRDGVELSASGSLGAGFEGAVAYAWLDARFTRGFSSGSPPVPVPAGSRLPGVPGSTLYAELVWRHAASGFHAGAELQASGKVYVNDANTDAAAGYAVASLRAGIERNFASWRLSAFARVDNVGGHAYAGSVIVAEARGRFFEPAPGRALMVGATATASF
jgi:iron complex outermembrane receptor protein